MRCSRPVCPSRGRAPAPRDPMGAAQRVTCLLLHSFLKEGKQFWSLRQAGCHTCRPTGIGAWSEHGRKSSAPRRKEARSKRAEQQEGRAGVCAAPLAHPPGTQPTPASTPLSISLGSFGVILKQDISAQLISICRD